MHPIERLRYVARAEGAGPTMLAREAAAALGTIGDDPAGLVTACRQLVARHARAGTMWWLAARVLSAPDPAAEARRAAFELDRDASAHHLAGLLPDDAVVTVLGWPELGSEALRRRGDVHVLVVDVAGHGMALVRRLRSVGMEVEDVSPAGLGAAVAESDVVLLEASALGPTGFVAPSGARAAAAVGRHAGVPVWLLAGAGRVLPGRLWEALTRRLGDQGEPWSRADEVVPLDLVDRVIGPGGGHTLAEAVRRADCPVTPELLREVH